MPHTSSIIAHKPDIVPQTVIVRVRARHMSYFVTLARLACVAAASTTKLLP